MSYVIDNVVGRLSDTAEVCIRYQAGIYEICGGTGGTGTFVVEQVALGQICLPLFLFRPVSIIATTFHTEFHLNTALSRRTSGRRLGSF
jgi:hypothetical protein